MPVTTEVEPGKIKAILPWFGGKRTMAPLIVDQLGQHGQYFEPFCGSMAVLFAKEPSQKETVIDLHGDLINLARCLQDPDAAEYIYDRCERTLFTDDLCFRAKDTIEQEFELGDGFHPDRAYQYFLASWQGRNGTAGTARQDYQLAVRWTRGGGSPTVRWRNVIDSIPWWHQRLRNVVIIQRDALDIIPRLEDHAVTAIYVDPPYFSSTRGVNVKNGKGGKYKHDFCDTTPHTEASRHRALADTLKTFTKARIVVSYYDCQEVRELYSGWTVVECTMNKQLNAQAGRGARKKEAPEILLINGPAYYSHSKEGMFDEDDN